MVSQLLKPNLGKNERLLRLTGGVLLILAALLLAPTPWNLMGSLGGLALMATGGAGVCLGYKMLGIDTNK
ncbi:DUF2892 domain-containing protein [Candidatus Cyanaurora vandensis]|uniref:YgaP family membrane protein n=1 Tax=Candidatus Cyanaurora vandensis TaxID=2714958 RepID=UPI00257A3691|nr:DUF2892 domain-containing protein [Candidatus Cyanaurora vandensis]